MKIAVLSDNIRSFECFMDSLLPNNRYSPNKTIIFYKHYKFYCITTPEHLMGRSFDKIIDNRVLSDLILTRLDDVYMFNNLRALCSDFVIQFKQENKELKDEHRID